MEFQQRIQRLRDATAELEQAQKIVDELRAVKHAEIVRAIEEGISQKEIAAATAYTRETIRKLSTQTN